MYEILTLQLGHRANHLATHFWNAQESYFTYDTTQAPSSVDHDVHFRPGIGAHGEETFTPRTLIYDLKGGFGSLRKWGGLYDQQQLGVEGTQGVWDGSIVLHTDTHIAQSDYQKGLEEGIPNPQNLTTETVRYWSDFNRVFYHPRSIVQINDYELNSTLMPFDQWDSGEELFVSMDRDADLLDRDVRAWVEECDHMQGLQVVTGADDAWGGFASRYVERLRDEFGKLPIWAWGIEEEQGRGEKTQQLLRTFNTARTLHEMATHASLYIPVSIPAGPLPQSLHLNRDSEWHVSALLSTALESMTLPSRLRLDNRKRGFLGHIETVLNVNGNQRIVQLQCSILNPEREVPKPVKGRMKSDNRAPSYISYAMLEEEGRETTIINSDINLSGGDSSDASSRLVRQRAASDHIFSTVRSIRGRLGGAKEEEGDEDQVTDARKRRRVAGLPIVERFCSSLEYPLLDSFPKIFLPADLTRVAIHTSLSATTRISSRVKALQKIVGRMMSLDEREALSNALGEISEAYEEGWNSGSDEDGDD